MPSTGIAAQSLPPVVHAYIYVLSRQTRKTTGISCTHVRRQLPPGDDVEQPDPALGAGQHLRPEQVPGAEVGVAELGGQQGALRPLARARSA